MSFVQTFGGNTIYPAEVSYRAFALTANVTLDWPTESPSTTNVVARVMKVTPSSSGYSVIMPAANEASPGEVALFFNDGAFSFNVADAGSNTIVAVAPGQAWQVILTTNATVNGTWISVQYGAGTSSATAGSLIGAGIKAIGTTLNQAMSATNIGTNYAASDADRSEVFNWTGGAGTFTLPSAATVGNDWFVHMRNSGTGGLTVVTSVGGQLINGSSSIILNPSDSSIVFCDGSNFFTIGLGRSAAFAFDFVSIDMTGQPSPYTLAGANLNRVSYRFTGNITGNVQVIVPATVQQYWVSNETDIASAPYTIEIKTLAGIGVTIARNQRAILYSDGTNVIDADTSSISLPLSLSQGGTAATDASGARVNLGATATGNAPFTASTAAAARSTLGSTATGDALFTAATAGDARTTIGATTVGGNIFTLANPSAIRFLRLNADNTVSALDAASFLTAIGAGSGGGTVSSVQASGGTTGMLFTGGPITSSGTLTLSGTLAVANGGTGATDAPTARTNLGATATGTAIFTAVDAASVRSTLALGSLATVSSINNTNWSGAALSVANGGTGAVTAPAARTALGSTAVGDALFTAATAGDARSTLALGSLATLSSVNNGNWSGAALTVANGGTGQTSLTANRLVRGLGTSAVDASIITDDGVSISIAGDATSTAGLRGVSLGVGEAASGTAGRIDATSIFVDRVEAGCAYTPRVAITVASTTTIDCNASNVFSLAMGTNIAILTLNNANNGQTINLRFYQDATGNRTISWPSSFKWPGGSVPLLSTAANAGDLCVATYFADTGEWWATLSKAFS